MDKLLKVVKSHIPSSGILPRDLAECKNIAAKAAVDSILLKNKMVVGIGSGSTIVPAVERLEERCAAEGKYCNFRSFFSHTPYSLRCICTISMSVLNDVVAINYVCIVFVLMRFNIASCFIL